MEQQRRRQTIVIARSAATKQSIWSNSVADKPSSLRGAQRRSNPFGATTSPTNHRHCEERSDEAIHLGQQLQRRLRLIFNFQFSIR
jgi:hypothetical protein